MTFTSPTSFSNSSTRLIRLPEVLQRTGLSRSALYRLIKSGNFPSQVQLTQRSVAWPEQQVLRWVNGVCQSAGGAE